MKAAIIRVSPAILAELLNLPEGSVLAGVATDIWAHGDLLLKVEGIGDDVVPGQMLREMRCTVTKTITGYYEVDWS